MTSDQASNESMMRLFAITLLLPKKAGDKFLDRYQAAIDALPEGGQLAIV
jgi:hypothetical protein